jgi:glycine cleavage system H protein
MAQRGESLRYATEDAALLSPASFFIFPQEVYAMNFPADLKYTRSDEWVRVEDPRQGVEGSTATAGITDYAQDQLSDIVYVEFPAVGASFKQDEAWGSVESVKAASEVKMPLSGTITEVNESLSRSPELVNGDPYGKGWMVKFSVTNPGELSGLMDAAAYQKYCEERKQ